MLRQRVATAAVAIPCVLAAVAWLPSGWLAVLFGLVLLLGAVEWADLIGLRKSLQKTLYVIVMAALFVLSWWLRSSAFFVDGILFVSVGWWCVALVAVVRYPRGLLASDSLRPAPVPSASGAVMGALVLLPGFMALMHVHEQYGHGVAWIFLLFALVWGADVGAYFAGRSLGRCKLAPAVSPGKTREGAMGGLLVAMLVTTAGAFWVMGLHGVRLWAITLLSVLVVAVSIVGDLLVSVFKRRADLKDTGMVFPGHGGVLDRLDSLLAAAPVFVLGLILLGWQ